MLVFAHVGITLGVATLLANLVPRRPSSIETIEGQAVSGAGRSAVAPPLERTSAPVAAWFARLGEYADIRFLLVGSLLPDIIDKPVGYVFFRETFSSGRIFSHTLVFALLLGVMGVYVYRRYHRNWLATLATGSTMHLVLDRMWEDPHTLLWPLYGVAFRRDDPTGWVPGIVRGLFTEPGEYVPELLGLAVLVLLVWVLWRRRALSVFVRRGRVTLSTRESGY